ncbi:hypothetical protein TH53_12425 [Pedobacter lusitanus]|uniref:Glycosyltransferase 2-like domain-containing protein n=1 Tax=Pedobacter lusitanus TaxID=1503925 RepID=A0A0D0GI29_9SPHI|nr:hypothetical protein [Pedobacter lusitanus]KIO76897.1 hypothetical protein TH53_12425 [Pedobacter lusitanus]
MLIITFIYVILVFLVLRFSVTVFNFLSNPKLGVYGRRFNDRVSVLIEATPDTTDLLELLKTIKEQDYQDIEVIIQLHKDAGQPIDLLAFCAEDQRFRLRKQRSGAAEDEATGAYFLFLGTHTVIRNGLINSLIYRTKVFNLTLLNIIPTQAISGLYNHCLLPLNNFVLLNLIPLRLVRLFSSPAFSAGTNQCMFFDAGVYKKYEWHRRLKGEIPEALEIVKAVKQENLKAETLVGHDLIYSYVSENQGSLIQKTGQRLLRIFGNNIFVATLYLLLVAGGPLLILTDYDYRLLILPAGLIFLSRIMISFLSGQNPLWNVLLHPVQMIFLVLSLSQAIFARIFQRVSKQKR